jgi:D-alanyl-lipoteichoic acid acyltransferase DltB (MBOAT superfamily)
MLFSEPIFFPFFLLCFAVRWSLRGYGTQKTFLWAASYVFYGAWDVRFLLLLAGSTVVDYFVGRNIDAATSLGRRRAWLVVCLCSNLGLLMTFKYFNFFTNSAVALLGGARADARGRSARGAQLFHVPVDQLRHRRL